MKTTNILPYKDDHRPPRGGWSPGGYCCSCTRCQAIFTGDKWAYICADCAYKEEPQEPKADPDHGPMDNQEAVLNRKFAAAQARVAELDKELNYEHGRHHLTHERANKAELRVAVLEKALEESNAALVIARFTIDRLYAATGPVEHEARVEATLSAIDNVLLSSRAAQPSREKEGA